LSQYGVFTVEDVTSPSSAAVRGKIIALAIKGDLSLFTNPAHDCSSTVRRKCWWDELVVSIECQPVVLLDRLLNLAIAIAGISEILAHNARQGRSMKRGKDRPITTRRTERLLEAFERIARLRWERCFFVGLALPEHDERPGLEVEVTPTNPASPFVVRITEYLGATDT
jgi:hypothetical protein